MDVATGDQLNAREGKLLHFIPISWARYLTWGLVLLFVVASIAQAPIMQRTDSSNALEQALIIPFVYLTFVAVGALLTIRLPKNPLGWLFLCIGCGATVGNAGQVYVEAAMFDAVGSLPAGEWTRYLAWYASMAWPLSMALMLFIPILYPDGRPTTRWLRRWFWLACIGYVAFFIGMAFSPGLLDIGKSYPVRNPLGWEAAESVLKAGEFLIFGLLIGFIAGILSLLLRARRSTGIEKQQIKWLGFGALFTLVFVFVVQNVAPALFPVLRQDRYEIVGNLIFGLGIAALPLSMGVAVLRYRLYDLGRLVNRAVVYVSLTAILAVIYLGGVALIRGVFSPLTGDSDIAVAGSTLAVAALFRPLRQRIQAFIDHRFYRRKYDATRTVDEFSSKLRDEIDLATLNDELVGVVHQTMHPTHVSIWLRPSREG